MSHSSHTPGRGSSLSGGLYVFRDEVEDAWFADTTFVAPAGEPRPAGEQLAAGRAAGPGRAASRMMLAADPTGCSPAPPAAGWSS